MYKPLQGSFIPCSRSPAMTRAQIRKCDGWADATPSSIMEQATCHDDMQGTAVMARLAA